MRDTLDEKVEYLSQIEGGNGFRDQLNKKQSNSFGCYFDHSWFWKEMIEDKKYRNLNSMNAYFFDINTF